MMDKQLMDKDETGTLIGSDKVEGTVVYGAPLKAKVLAKLLMTAVNLFKGGKNQNLVEFTDTEAEARVWLDRRRRDLAAGIARVLL